MPFHLSDWLLAPGFGTTGFCASFTGPAVVSSTTGAVLPLPSFGFPEPDAGEEWAGGDICLLCVVSGFGGPVVGAKVSTGSLESTPDCGVAAGDVATAGNVGTAMASAGCKAFGAGALGQ